MSESGAVAVEFALAYDPENLDNSHRDRPWRDLPRESRRMAVTTTLASAGVAGAELLVPQVHRLSLESDPWGYELGLFVARDRPALMVAELDIVDRLGRVHWGRGTWQEITLEQALRSHAAGTLPGDPHGLALMRPGRGAGGVITLWEAFNDVWAVLGDVLQAYAGYELARKLIAKVRPGRKAVEENLAEWQLRQATTRRFIRLLSQQAWKPQDLGRLLDCSDEDAAATLGIFGFLEDADGRFHPGEEGAEGFLWALVQRIERSYADEGKPSRSAVEAILRAQVEELIETNGARATVDRRADERLP